MQTFIYKGKISELGEVKTGTSRTGTAWQAQEVIIADAEGGRAKFRAFGEVVDQIAELKVGDGISAEFSVSGHVWKDNFYNDLSLIKVEGDLPF